MSTTIVPPIKCQGIKTKLVPIIHDIESTRNYERWVEPFMGSGVVGFNIKAKKALFADSNPHLINFYNSLKNDLLSPDIVRNFLISEGEKLSKSNGEYYYTVRERFNKDFSPLDFLFLNRSCFNGMIRFNSKGGFNVPFCRKPERFAPALITKITNQVSRVKKIIDSTECEFVCQSFKETLKNCSTTDLIYCDPPYIGRHVDYFDSWSEEDEYELHRLLKKTGAHFILSSWFENKYRKNEYIEIIWKDLNITTQEHFYHVGASEANRNSMLEALLTNFPYEKGDLELKGNSQLEFGNMH